MLTAAGENFVVVCTKRSRLPAMGKEWARGQPSSILWLDTTRGPRPCCCCCSSCHHHAGGGRWHRAAAAPPLHSMVATRSAYPGTQTALATLRAGSEASNTTAMASTMVVPPSKHTLFMRGFTTRQNIDKIRLAHFFSRWYAALTRTVKWTVLPRQGFVLGHSGGWASRHRACDADGLAGEPAHGHASSWDPWHGSYHVKTGL